MGQRVRAVGGPSRGRYFPEPMPPCSEMAEMQWPQVCPGMKSNVHSMEVRSRKMTTQSLNRIYSVFTVTD